MKTLKEDYMKSNKQALIEEARKHGLSFSDYEDKEIIVTELLKVKTRFEAGKQYWVLNKELGWFKATLRQIYKDGKHYFTVDQEVPGYGKCFTVYMFNNKTIERFKEVV